MDGADWEQKWKLSAESLTPLVVMFTAKWCAPCKKVYPLFTELCEKYGSDTGEAHHPSAIFVKVDIDAHKELARKYNPTKMIPTFVILDRGEDVARLTGANREKLAAFVAEALD